MNGTICVNKEKAHKAMLQAKYDQIIDDYDRCGVKDVANIYDELFGDYDKITLDNVHHRTAKNLENFLKAGFDANQIVKLLSHEDVWIQYDLLKSYGAEFGVLKKKTLDYLKFLYAYNKDEFIVDNFVTFYERGVGFTTILSNLNVGFGRYAGDNGHIESKLREKMSYEKLLEDGVDEKTAKQLADNYKKYMK